MERSATLVNNSLRDYWILVRGHRQGDQSCLLALQLMAHCEGPAAMAAARYCKKSAA